MGTRTRKFANNIIEDGKIDFTKYDKVSSNNIELLDLLNDEKSVTIKDYFNQNKQSNYRSRGATIQKNNNVVTNINFDAHTATDVNQVSETIYSNFKTFYRVSAKTIDDTPVFLGNDMSEFLNGNANIGQIGGVSNVGGGIYIVNGEFGKVHTDIVACTQPSSSSFSNIQTWSKTYLVYKINDVVTITEESSNTTTVGSWASPAPSVVLDSSLVPTSHHLGIKVTGLPDTDIYWTASYSFTGMVIGLSGGGGK
jgi:hypothetical protein